MSKPRVSVVIPTYNRAGLLRECIDSVLAQTFKDFELVIVDDASTDDTEQVVKSIDDPRIRYEKREKRGGGGAARNTGISAARADLIAFQDSDDIWNPTKLERQMALLDSCSEDVGVIYCAFERHRRGAVHVIPAGYFPEGWVQKEMLYVHFIGTVCTLVRARYLREVGGFDENLPRLQDWDMFVRLSRVCQFRAVKEVLVLAKTVAQGDKRGFASLTENDAALERAYEIILNKHKEELAAVPVAQKHHFQVAAKVALSLRKRKRALSFIRKSAKISVARDDVSLLLRALGGESAYQLAHRVYRGWLK